MSKVLNRITGNTDKMKKTIEDTQQQMNQETNFSKNLTRDEQKLEQLGAQYAHQVKVVQRLREEYEKSIGVKGKYSEATEKIRGKLLSAQASELRLAEAVEKAGKSFEKQNNEMYRASKSTDGLINKIKGLVGAYLSFRAVKGLLKSTIGEAGELTRRAGIMEAAFGNKDVGKNYFNQLQLYAIETRHDIDDLIDTTRNFMQLTKNTKHLKGFTDAANKLSLRTNGIGSAENLMQEAIRGNFTRLQRVLHLTDAQIAPLKKAIARGSMDGIIKGFDDALNTAGLTDAVVEAYQNSPISKMEKAIDRFKTGMAMAGEEALARLEPLLDRLNTWLQSSNADNFFGAIALGITMVVEFITWLTNIIVSNWDIIAPILTILITVYLVSLISQLWAVLPPLLAQLGMWVALNWPILVVVTAIVLFITMLHHAGITADQVTGFIGAVFFGLYAFLFNVIAGLWNGFASLAEFFVNVWKHPVYSTKALFANMATNILDMAISMTEGFDSVATNLANAFISGANLAIGAINGIIGALNKIPGVNIGEIGKLGAAGSVTGGLKNARANVGKWLGDAPSDYWKAPKMEMKSIGAYAQKGYDFGASIPGKFSTGLDNIKNSIGDFAGQEDAWNKGQGDKLGNLGNAGKGLGKQGKDLNKTAKGIEKGVNKSSEDLKYLRDIAEQEVINRFTTAEIKIEQNNQNNINSEMDLDGVINYLVEGTEEAVTIAAEGVY